jgi:hypothetical protein
MPVPRYWSRWTTTRGAPSLTLGQPADEFLDLGEAHPRLVALPADKVVSERPVLPAIRADWLVEAQPAWPGLAGREGVADLTVGGRLSPGECPAIGKALDAGHHTRSELRHLVVRELRARCLVGEP